MMMLSLCFVLFVLGCGMTIVCGFRVDHTFSNFNSATGGPVQSYQTPLPAWDYTQPTTFTFSVKPMSLAPLGLFSKSACSPGIGNGGVLINIINEKVNVYDGSNGVWQVGMSTPLGVFTDGSITFIPVFGTTQQIVRMCNATMSCMELPNKVTFEGYYSQRPVELGTQDNFDNCNPFQGEIKNARVYQGIDETMFLMAPAPRDTCYGGNVFFNPSVDGPQTLIPAATPQADASIRLFFVIEPTSASNYGGIFSYTSCAGDNNGGFLVNLNQGKVQIWDSGATPAVWRGSMVAPVGQRSTWFVHALRESASSHRVWIYRVGAPTLEGAFETFVGKFSGSTWGTYALKLGQQNTCNTFSGKIFARACFSLDLINPYAA